MSNYLLEHDSYLDQGHLQSQHEDIQYIYPEVRPRELSIWHWKLTDRQGVLGIQKVGITPCSRITGLSLASWCLFLWLVVDGKEWSELNVLAALGTKGRMDKGGKLSKDMDKDIGLGHQSWRQLKGGSFRQSNKVYRAFLGDTAWNGQLQKVLVRLFSLWNYH